LIGDFGEGHDSPVMQGSPAMPLPKIPD
jgi:hypothetical protein